MLPHAGIGVGLCRLIFGMIVSPPCPLSNCIWGPVSLAAGALIYNVAGLISRDSRGDLFRFCSGGLRGYCQLFPN
jgi:hypothetical protein